MDSLRALPKVDALSRSVALAGFPTRVRVEAARRAIDEMRQMIQSGTLLKGQTAEELAVTRARGMTGKSLRPAINLSGVVLHTGLGRARLARAAVDQIAAVAAQHSLLELDDETGKRGNRQDHVRGLICELTGAEDAHVVNNAAAAVVLSLRALAGDREVVLSRGQMVEIGGSFRMPDIVRESGCRLVEVGTTNKTRINDYEEALTENCGAVLRCHTSNFKIIGFTEQPPLEQVVHVAHAYGLPCIDDMGTGCILDTSSFGMVKVPTIQDSLAAGADVVTASGDKLLGGPQCGLIVGKRVFLDRIRKHPLARAVRIDKLTLAALEATLRLYIQGLEAEVPTIFYLSRPAEVVKKVAHKLASCVKGSKVAEGTTEVGGGSAPGTGVSTWRVSLQTDHPDELLAQLRGFDPPIIARIEGGAVWLDPRTLDDDEVETVCEVLRSL
ncbi:MAG: L-seryl-tRNA(Sec) selenium transferase [Fimbriimonadales bacterium]